MGRIWPFPALLLWLGCCSARRFGLRLNARGFGAPSALVPVGVTNASNVDLQRNILIMTTASVPWLTGTAINPLLRAAYLARQRDDGAVTLFVPWVDAATQLALKFPTTFATRGDQAAYVTRWLEETAEMPDAARKLRVAFYDAHYHAVQGSIYSMGETVELLDGSGKFERYTHEGILDGQMWHPDVVVLEEPEHLNWYAYRDGDRSSWRGQFPHVVGVVHTNYVRYAATERVCGGIVGEMCQPVVGPLKALAALLFAKWMCAAHCHRVIKLSGAIPKMTRRECEVVSNVHGVRSQFLEIGDAAAASPLRAFAAGDGSRTAGAYFIGKMIWQKGLDRLVDLLARTQRDFGGALPSGQFHLVGDGNDRQAIEKAFGKKGIDATFHGRHDHAAPLCQNYRVLVNPSLTEVLCTTIAEALAMGKWVILAKHPSNAFFYQFPSCLVFEDEAEFVRHYAHAMRHEPPKLDSALRHVLTWDAATRRFCDAAAISLRDAPRTLGPLQRLAAFLHVRLGRGLGGDAIRSVAGAGLTVGPQAAFVKRKRRQEARDAAEKLVAQNEASGPAEAPVELDRLAEPLPDEIATAGLRS
ncbi:hypothetical protein M885DRAFT_514973 [Pelagophyceae sp. CCMP2097]|nr:hypothetical protein M885DRAFT_514973 [Pelagophyceae sp. CCMP2097]